MTRPTTYRDAGVDLDAAEAAMDGIREAVRSTYDERVLAGIGAFGGLFRLGETGPDPVLVASTDGVGTKTKVAAATGRWSGLGRDLVNHCIDDILVQGARPLFFLDYVASARLEPAVIAAVVGGVAAACREAGAPLLGGETAEMPGVYEPGEIDLVGTIVGLVERGRIVDGARARAGDAVLALASGGLQTNGFSLARTVLDGAYAEPFEGGDVADALLLPHRSYLQAVAPLLEAGVVRAMAHVTGGGIPGNLPRALPAGLGAEIRTGSWPEPGIFDLIRRRGGVAEGEMRRAFNLGAGFLVVVGREDVEAARTACPEELYEIGRIVEGRGVRWA